MWNSGVSAPGNGRMALVPTVTRREPAPIEPVSDVSAVKTLFNQLFEAEQTSKTQLARDLRDKLNAKREEISDEKLKDILNQMIESDETPLSFLEFLRRLRDEWFPASDSALGNGGAENAGGGSGVGGGRRGGGGGGGGGGNANVGGGQRSAERMSDKPLSVGAGYTDYRPDSSAENAGKKPKNIWSGFSQGQEGNCGTVSAIKASMMHFGQKPTDIYKEVKEAGNGYDVTMRDGYKLHLSRDELKQAARGANFKGDDPEMMTDANFMFAVSAKRAQEENNDGRVGMSYGQAIDSLNDGEWSKEAFDRLGLKNHVKQVSLSDLARGAVGTADTNIHSVAVVNGRKELWGGRGGYPTEGIAFGFV